MATTILERSPSGEDCLSPTSRPNMHTVNMPYIKLHLHQACRRKILSSSNFLISNQENLNSETILLLYYYYLISNI